MSLVFNRISRLSFGRSARILCFRQDSSVQENIRLFSSSPTPYLLLPSDVVEESSAGGKVVNFNLYDPRKEEIVKIPDQTLPRELYPSRRIGSSHGWLALMNKRDFSLQLTNMFNPSASMSSHKVIPLPPIDSLPCFRAINRNQDGSVTNVIQKEFVPIESPRYAISDIVRDVSLSSSPDHDDCIVAIRIWDHYLCFCRPGDSEWTCIKVPSSFYTTNVMYSKRDRVFYLTTRAHHSMYACDLNNPKFTPKTSSYPNLRLCNLPEMTESEVKLLEMCVEREHLVQTPSGELFTIIRYVQSFHEGEAVSPWDEFIDQDLFYKTKRFMVFRHDIKKGTGSYTEDIGDLCIFLGKNESFCLRGSQYPGLKPNSIYFADDYAFMDTPDEGYAGHDMGVYDLATGEIAELCQSGPEKILPAPIWLAPMVQ